MTDQFLPVFRIFSFQALSIDLAAIVLRQTALEDDAARVFVHGQSPLDELLQLARKFGALRESFVQHDVGRCLGQPVLVLKAYYGAFTNGLVFEQAVFDLGWRNE